MMISKKYTLWALNPLLLTMMAPAVAQQKPDDETFVVSANRNRTRSGDGAKPPGLSKTPNWNSRFRAAKSLKTHWLS